MSQKAPFVVYLRVVASRGKRFETIRSLQRLATLIYMGADGTTGLLGNANLAMALPGGGQASGLNGGDMTDYIAGCAYKPQFGQTPAQLDIPGFYLLSSDAAQAWPDQTVTHANEYVTGAGGSWAWRSNPSAAVLTEIKNLKAIVDGVIAADTPGEGVSVWRIDYKGVVFGERGLHFPL